MDVHEKQLCQVLCAYRISLPFVGITVSSRESESFRNGIVKIAATRISAGVSSGIGDHESKYSGKENDDFHGDEHFEIDDGRSLDKMYADISEEGLQPVLNELLIFIGGSMKNLNTTMYFITDSGNYSEEEFLYRTEEACKGGVTLIQLREKDKTTRAYIKLAEKVHEITQRYSIPLIINDRVDIALAINAEGVHVGQSDMPVKTARLLMGENKIVGATAKTVEQAQLAYSEGADYLGVGAIYPTTTKVKTVLTSVDKLKEIVKAVPIKVNAIGGLNKDNIGVLKDSGIDGICVVSAIMKADTPRLAAMELKAAAENLTGNFSKKG